MPINYEGQWHLPDGDFWGKIKTLKPRQDGSRFADNIFKCIFLNEMNLELKLDWNFNEICS